MHLQKNNPNEAARQIGKRAAHLFITKQRWCAAAVLVTNNSGMGGGLPAPMAIRITSGLGHGLSGSGCTCGALSGAALTVGLFLGDGNLAPIGNRPSSAATHELHRRFKTQFGSTCCRVLTRGIKEGSKEHYKACALRTEMCARWSAELILDRDPELIRQVDWAYLQIRESRIAARLKRITGRFNISNHEPETIIPEADAAEPGQNLRLSGQD